MKLAPAGHAALAALVLLGASAALACGYCVEDRVAAVYDYAVSLRTAQRGHQLAYFGWDGPGARGEAARRKLLALGQAVAGVDHDSVRVSMEPAAIAVAFDPRRSSVASITSALQKQLATVNVSIVPLPTPGAIGKQP